VGFAEGTNEEPIEETERYRAERQFVTPEADWTAADIKSFRKSVGDWRDSPEKRNPYRFELPLGYEYTANLDPVASDDVD
jgi:hypothetical protein